jgi:hypothetical protein
MSRKFSIEYVIDISKRKCNQQGYRSWRHWHKRVNGSSQNRLEKNSRFIDYCKSQNCKTHNKEFTAMFLCEVDYVN